MEFKEDEINKMKINKWYDEDSKNKENKEYNNIDNKIENDEIWEIMRLDECSLDQEELDKKK